MTTKTLTATAQTEGAHSPYAFNPANGSKDNPMSRSLILDFGLQKHQVDPKTTSQLGESLLDRAEKIRSQVEMARNLLSSAAQNPSRFGCSVVTTLAGISQIYSGSIFSGGAMAAIGIKELYNQCRPEDNSSLGRLLSDINANAGMMQHINKDQKGSYKFVNENLALIHDGVRTLYDQLDQINELNTDTDQTIKEAKKQAAEKGTEAKEAYREALQLFSETKDAFGVSKEIYGVCAEYFKQIEALATDESKDRTLQEKVNSLGDVAAKAQTQCSLGKEKLDLAAQKFSAAMASFSKASKLKDEAIELISKTVQKAQDALVTGAEIAKHTAECTQKIEATQKEMKDVNERHEDITKLLDETRKCAERAEIEAAKKLDPSDLIVGIGAAIALTPVGAFSALAAGVTAAYAWHNGTTIANTTRKVYSCFFGPPLPPPVPMAKDEIIRVKFQGQSSGYWNGWVRGRQSFTLGTVDVKLGGEVMQLGFDLNNGNYPVSSKDLFNLYGKMQAMLEKKTLQPDQCKKVIKQLQDVVVSRGGFNPDVKGLIKEKQGAHGLVKSLLKYCNKLQGVASV